MLLSPQAISAVAGKVTSDDFYKPAHRHVFDAIQALSADGRGVDPVTVSEELQRLELLESIGGSAELLTLQTRTPAITNAEYYANIVAEKALLRRLISAAREVGELGYAPLDDVDKTIDQAESAIFAVAQRRETDTTRPMSELVSPGIDRLEELQERKQAVSGTPTGFTRLDRLLSGMQPDSLSIVGARPGVGKTAFALSMAAHISIREQLPVLFFSLEMSRLELTYRLLSSEAKVQSTKFRNANMNSRDWQKINQAGDELSRATMWIDDNPAVSLMEIRGKARRLQDRLGEKLGLVVVDYLQLMQGRGGAESRQVEVSEISRGLKVLARELQAPVMALSQLSRQLESRTSDRRPQLSDLRESGCLTADTLLRRADDNTEISLRDLADGNLTNVPVWSLDQDWRMVPGTLTKAFPSGTKEVFRLRMASGREIKASANHPFRTILGWRRLDELAVGSRLAVPRLIHAPENLVSVDSERLDEWVNRVCQGSPIPEEANALNDSQLAHFLSRLFGRMAYLSVTQLRGKPHVRLAASCSRPEVLRDVQELLLRFGIHGRISATGANRKLHRLWIHGVDQQRQFLTTIGVDGPKSAKLTEALQTLGDQKSNPNVDTIPCEVRDLVVAELGRAELTQRQLAGLLREKYCGGYLLGTEARPRCSSRSRLARIAEALDSKDLSQLATSEVMWDEVHEITSLGEQPTYDATVAGTHNFVANGVIAHNSIEQDADVVMFLYRDAMYNKETDDNTTEVIVAKHRAGPTDVVELMFHDYCTRFEDIEGE